MGKGGGGTNTVVQNSAPPSYIQSAYQNVLGQASQAAAQPYQPYTGQTIAGFSPDQQAAFGEVQGAQGIANPYINAASQYIGNSTTPLWGSTQQFSPGAVSQYESPYTQQVVGATEQQFQNTNAQQQNQLQGNAASQGALGGDRVGVAQGVLAGQQQAQEAPVIAGLENQGYTQALGEFNTQQQAQLGANEANSWLNSQAGFGMANLGNEAQNTALSGASALLNTGGLEQQMGQEQLNVPYEQYLAQQAYPFQTSSWLAGIANEAAGGSGGQSSTTSPTPSNLSQIAGLGIGGLGVAGQLGAFSGAGAGAGAAYTAGDAATAALAADAAASYGTAAAAGYGADAAAATIGAAAARGGRMTRRGMAAGGIAPQLSVGSGMSMIPGSYAGAPAIPQLPTGAIGGGSLGSSPSSLQSYLSGIQSAVNAAPTYKPVPLPASSAPTNPQSSLGSGLPANAQLFNFQADPYDYSGQTVGNLSTPNGQEFGYFNPSGQFQNLGGSNMQGMSGGGHRRGGRVGFADGGSTPDQSGLSTIGDLMEMQELGMGMARGGRPRYQGGGDVNLGPSSDLGLGSLAQVMPVLPQDPTGGGGQSPTAPATMPLPAPLPPMQRRPISFGAGTPRGIGAGMGIPRGPSPAVAAPGYPQGGGPGGSAGLVPVDTSGMGAGLDRRASPWLGLAQAGFDIAGQRSPFALQNIGAGAAQGLAQYENVDKAAQDLAARVDEAKARIGETSLYQAAMTQNRSANTGIRAEQAAASQATAQDRLALAADRLAAAAGARGSAAGRPSTAGMESDLVNNLVGTANPDTGKPYTKPEAEAYVLGVSARAQRAATGAQSAQARASQAAQNEQSLQQFRLSSTQRAYASSILASQPAMKPAEAAAEAQRLFPGAPAVAPGTPPTAGAGTPAAPVAAPGAAPTSQNAVAAPSPADVAYLRANAASDPSIIQRFAAHFGPQAAAQYAPKVTGIQP